MKKILTLVILSAVFFSSSSHAQQKATCTIKGAVIDTTTNTPVQYSTLSIATKAEPTKQVKVLATDDKGNFQIGLTSAGEYILSVFYFGNKAADIPFTVEEGKKTVDLGTIGIIDISQLEEAVVVAQKPLVKVELDKLTYDTESDPDARTETALEMLKKVPMVTVDGDDKIQLRGSTNFKVYVNNKPSSMVTNNPSEVLKSMPAANIKNIEVITDPGAKYDAEGIGGIINITMAKSGDDGYTATVGANVNTLGSYGGSANLTLKQGKLGFSGYYNYNLWRSPKSTSSLFREDYSDNSILNQEGNPSRSSNPGQWGSAELSYEFDTLNMVTVAATLYGGKYENNSTSSTNLTGGSKPYSYNSRSNTEGDWGSTELNANYQRSFKKKGVLLTASYRFDGSPDNSNYETQIYDGVNYDKSWERSNNEASTKEHTFQVDYVNPINSKHTVEVGSKYIIRLNNSDPFLEEYNYLTSMWERNTKKERPLDYRQDILSGYASYSYKLKKLGFKAGLRVEDTQNDLNFSGVANRVESNTTDVVPSAAISYQLGMTKTLRFNYNMRISRPSIWYLNPYRNESNPNNIRYGNPYLDSEDSHSFSLSYGSFSQKVNINASLRYTILSNAIQEYSFMVNDTLNTTYGNIGKNQSIGLNLYGSWTPIKDLRLMVNGNINYVDIKATSTLGNSSNGYGGNGYFNASYTFLKSFRASCYAGFFIQPITMQSKTSPFSYMGLGLGKDFFDKKLSVNINVQDPFRKTSKYTRKTYGQTFYQESIYRNQQQSVGFRVSYRFGNLKNQQLKKVQRGITNDDVMQGGNSSSGSGNTPTTN